MALLLWLGGWRASRADCVPPVKHCIPVAVFARPQVSDRWIATQIEAANSRLAVIDVGIELASRSELPAVNARIDTRAQRNALFRFGSQAPLRIFLVDRLADSQDPKATRRGVTWRRGSDFLVIVDDDATRWVLPHELGHVLGLPHSDERRSIMNKAVRLVLPSQLGYTAREQPIMRRTLERLLSSRRLVEKRR